MDIEDRKRHLAAIEALKSTERLWKADLLPKPKIVAVDLDGTILTRKKDCTKLGTPISGIREKLQRLKDLGWVVVIWSVRAESPEILAHLKKHDIPFDFFNWHPWQPKEGGPKVLADCYIDDNAINFSGDPSDFDQVLVHRPWWSKGE
jgi:hypothetical protein